MEKNDVIKTVAEILPNLSTELGLKHWTISFKTEVMTDPDTQSWQVQGRCNASPAYDKALIRLNPEALDDEKEVFEITKHELFHVVLSPFDLYNDVIGEFVVGNDQAVKALDHVLHYAREQAVVNLERMYTNMKEVAEADKKAAVKAAVDELTKSTPVEEKSAKKPPKKKA